MLVSFLCICIIGGFSDAFKRYFFAVKMKELVIFLVNEMPLDLNVFAGIAPRPRVLSVKICLISLTNSASIESTSMSLFISTWIRR